MKIKEENDENLSFSVLRSAQNHCGQNASSLICVLPGGYGLPLHQFRHRFLHLTLHGVHVFCVPSFPSKMKSFTKYHQMNRHRTNLFKPKRITFFRGSPSPAFQSPKSLSSFTNSSPSRSLRRLPLPRTRFSSTIYKHIV